jgi:branched-chain amino acid transport system permease protein
VGGGMMAMYSGTIAAAPFKSSLTYEILLIVVIGGIGSITGSVLASFLYIFSSEWLLRGLDSGTFLGINAPGVFKNGFRMAVFSVIIMLIVLFFRRGLMGDKELPDLLDWQPKKGKKEAAGK